MSKLKKNKKPVKKQKLLTNKKIIISLVVLLLVVVLISFINFSNNDSTNESNITNTNLDNNTENETTESSIEDNREIEKLEIIHFHGTNQCQSCILVGDYAEETINAYFSEELNSGKITFMHINGELEENLDLVKKYNVTSSSLFIGTYYKNGEFEAEQNINVWYKINDKEEYMNYLKGIIQEKLS